MAGSDSDYSKDAINDHVLKVSPLAVPDNLYVARYTVAPTDAGGGTEVTGGGYARIIHNSWNPSSGGVSTNDGVITWPTATAGQGTTVAIAIHDALTGGNFLRWGDLDDDKVVSNGDDFRIADDGITVTRA